MMVAEKRKWPQAQAQIPLQEGVSENAYGKDDVYKVVKQHAVTDVRSGSGMAQSGVELLRNG